MIKGGSASKHFVCFKSPLSLYENIKEERKTITLEKAKQKQEELEINEKVKGGKKWKGKKIKSAINNIKTRNESREKIVKLFDDFF